MPEVFLTPSRVRATVYITQAVHSAIGPMAAAARGQPRAAVGGGESGDGAHGLAMPRAVPLCHSCHLSPRCRGG
eukprot:1225836-Prymnesium_polylepis.1